MDKLKSKLILASIKMNLENSGYAVGDYFRRSDSSLYMIVGRMINGSMHKQGLLLNSGYLTVNNRVLYCKIINFEMIKHQIDEGFNYRRQTRARFR